MMSFYKSLGSSTELFPEMNQGEPENFKSRKSGRAQFDWPTGKKAASDNSIQNARIAWQVMRQCRRRSNDINQQVDKGRVCLEQRKKLHTGR